MPLGKWGRLVMRNIEEHHPERLEAMREAGTLDARLAELDQLGDRMAERLLMQKLEGPGVPEGSLGRMQFAQSAQSEVEEIVLSALLDPPPANPDVPTTG